MLVAEVNVGDVRGKLVRLTQGPELNEYRYTITTEHGTVVHDINLLAGSDSEAFEVMLQELAIESAREDVAELLWDESVRETARTVRRIVRMLS